MKAAAALALVALVLGAPAAQAAGPEVTLLLHHPNDGVDPFGIDYAGGRDYFTQHYAPLVADKGRFDFPFFVADGLHPLEGPVNASKPFVAARDAYGALVDDRLGERAPLTLRLATTLAEPSAVLAVRLEPTAPLPGEHLHVLVALAEDPVHFLPPAGLTNGVEDHRFTVRAVADLGVVDLAAGTAVDLSRSFALADDWQRDRLVAAAWVQQDAPSSRFDAREVVQATHVAVGGEVVQDNKGVLMEMLSATWCEPCLYGDLAVEAVAVQHGAAEPLAVDDGPRYFQAAGSPLLALGLAAAVGLAVAWWGGRKP